MKALLALLLGFLSIAPTPALEPVLQIPPLTAEGPGPGRRFTDIAPEYQGTGVHHQVYLPPDWSEDAARAGRMWPVVVEYTGNLHPPSGSSGKVEDAALGFGLCGGTCIWIVLPFVSPDHQSNQLTWWGDALATVDYAKQNVPRLCARFGGDPAKVVLCGFSRGAIAVNYIGLYDDEIAKLWCAFFAHDHYDGVREWSGTAWGAPLERYRSAAVARLQRLRGRPAMVCQANELGGEAALQRYLAEHRDDARFSFLGVGMKNRFGEIPNRLFPNAHTDRWMLADSPERAQARRWFEAALDAAR